MTERGPPQKPILASRVPPLSLPPLQREEEPGEREGVPGVQGIGAGVGDVCCSGGGGWRGGGVKAVSILKLTDDDVEMLVSVLMDTASPYLSLCCPGAVLSAGCGVCVELVE